MHPAEPVRYIGLDIHKHFVMRAAVDEQQQMSLSPRRIGTKQLASWASTHLLPTDQLIMEATTNVWVLHDLLRPHVASVTAVHPFHVKIITASFVKTDKRDALALAKLLVTRLAPAIWIPPQHVRELRSLVTHRKHLMKQCTATKNRLQGVIFRYNLTAPQGDLYARTNRA